MVHEQFVEHVINPFSGAYGPRHYGENISDLDMVLNKRLRLPVVWPCRDRATHMAFCGALFERVSECQPGKLFVAPVAYVQWDGCSVLSL